MEYHYYKWQHCRHYTGLVEVNTHYHNIVLKYTYGHWYHQPRSVSSVDFSIMLYSLFALYIYWNAADPMRNQ